ncbi:hypothetical protein BH11MYX4_BH11MYX4_52470 [soil metagenome]
MTSGRAAALTFVAALSLASPAAADGAAGPSPTGIRVGVRTGFALPAGQAFNGSGALSDTIQGYVPLRLDLGVRIARHFYVGALVQRAAIVPDACSGELSCTGSNTRFGVLVGLHLRPAAFADPWVAVGLGYEVLSVSRTTATTRLDLDAKGLELVDVELGLDLRPFAGLRVGPAVSTSIGRYTSISLNGRSTSDFNTVMHGWVLFGLRGAWDL